jgi:hyaluronoglucosaminidase
MADRIVFQLVNITDHVLRMKADIDRHIPDVHFDGLAVIDWEEWRPRYEANWSNRKLYQDMSKKHIIKMSPKINATDLEKVAAKKFNIAAK